jgi:putative transposase
VITRNKTPSNYVYYTLHLYFSGFSLRRASEILSQLFKRNHVLLAKKWNWIQKYKPQKLKSTRRRVLEYIIDETMLKVGSEFVWLWVATEPENSQILALSISKERNMFVAERFIGGLIKFNGKRPISPDGGTWYPMACMFLGLKHHNHSPYEKSIIERTMQFIKNRTESFDDYFSCRVKNCKLNHVRNWLNMFLVIIIARSNLSNEQSPIDIGSDINGTIISGKWIGSPLSNNIKSGFVNFDIMR